jgi:hypothetical protein
MAASSPNATIACGTGTARVAPLAPSSEAVMIQPNSLQPVPMPLGAVTRRRWTIHLPRRSAPTASANLGASRGPAALGAGEHHLTGPSAPIRAAGAGNRRSSANTLRHPREQLRRSEGYRRDGGAFGVAGEPAVHADPGKGARDAMAADQCCGAAFQHLANGGLGPHEGRESSIRSASARTGRKGGSGRSRKRRRSSMHSDQTVI